VVAFDFIHLSLKTAVEPPNTPMNAEKIKRFYKNMSTFWVKEDLFQTFDFICEYLRSLRLCSVRASAVNRFFSHFRLQSLQKLSKMLGSFLIQNLFSLKITSGLLRIFKLKIQVILR